MEDMVADFRDLSIEAIEPLDIDEVMANFFIDLDLNDTADLDLNDTADDDMISVPGLVEDFGYLGDCEDIINNWNRGE